tara:strand:- start:282 stop:674 length:393 start_codon:yes stop_codon:yes gene_type:complete
MKKVWTNGCFDILHRGHIELFRFANNLGDELMVGLDTDSKVKKDKGEGRPINNLEDRVFMLSAIKYIKGITYFDSASDLENVIKLYAPDVIVVGSDWKGKTVVGEQYAKEVVFFDRVGDYSTTNIINGDK